MPMEYDNLDELRKELQHAIEFMDDAAKKATEPAKPDDPFDSTRTLFTWRGYARKVAKLKFEIMEKEIDRATKPWKLDNQMTFIENVNGLLHDDQEVVKPKAKAGGSWRPETKTWV